MATAGSMPCGLRSAMTASRRRASVVAAVPRATAAADDIPTAPAAAHPLPARRRVLAAGAATLVGAAVGLGGARPARAFIEPPPGFRLHEDRLDGYYFFYPADWLTVTTSGNDAFFRHPRDVDENLFVNISSPSSSKYETVADLGSPEAAAGMLLKTYTGEFMSTRLGVKRTGSVTAASQRTGPDGRLYYDITLRQRSVASRQQLAVAGVDVTAGLEVEWDRVYRTVLGVAGRRLYEFRLQAPISVWEAEREGLEAVAGSFRCKEVDL